LRFGKDEQPFGSIKDDSFTPVKGSAYDQVADVKIEEEDGFG
jgi:hypothetical protein